MLWTIVAVFFSILWLLGFSLSIGGSLIHLLLVVALVLFVINLANTRRGFGVDRPPKHNVPMTESHPSKVKKHRSGPFVVRRFFAGLGPGLITGAADDDPSGISTYSVTGAAFGYAPLWTALFSFPLMTAVQMMCARLGMVTGEGLAGVIRRRYPRWVLWGACALLVIANTVNIGADLGGMGKVTEMVTGIRGHLLDTDLRPDRSDPS